MYPPPNPRPFIGPRRSGSGPLPQPLRVASPPALKRRGLRRCTQAQALFSFWGLPLCPPAWPVGWPGGGSAIPQPRPKCKGKMHGPAFILFGRGRPCILSVPAASGGPPDDRAPFLGLRACGHGPHRQSSTPLLPCWEPHCSTASRVCARRSHPGPHSAGGHIRKPPASCPAAALRRAGPLFCAGPALDCAVLLKSCPTGQKGVTDHVHYR